MTLKKSFLLCLLLLPMAGALAGCDSNPTNAPTKEDADKADRDRAAAIDKDPSLSPDQKAIMKEHMGLGPKASAQR